MNRIDAQGFEAPVPTKELDLSRIADVMRGEIGKLVQGHGARRLRSMIACGLCRSLTLRLKHSK